MRRGTSSVGHRMLTVTIIAVIAAISGVMGGCGGTTPDAGTASDDPPVIVCTIGMIADIAREVAGDRAEVISLMGADIDPHLYKPTRTDMRRLQQADIIFYNGLHLEGRMTSTLDDASAAGRTVIAVTERLDPSTLLDSDDASKTHDPHVWMDPRAWMRAVRIVTDTLKAHDPSGAAAYDDRSAAYLEELEALDAYAARVLATVPEDRRVLVTAHDAFGYFGQRYDYEVVGVQGISTESEAGVLDIERLVDLLVTRGISAVFVESTVSNRNVNALISGARARDHAVVNGGTLFSDAMGPAGSYEGTYIGMIDHNVTTITRALGGDAPEGGMQGRLGQRDS